MSISPQADTEPIATLTVESADGEPPPSEPAIDASVLLVAGSAVVGGVGAAALSSQLQ